MEERMRSLGRPTEASATQHASNKRIMTQTQRRTHLSQGSARDDLTQLMPCNADGTHPMSLQFVWKRFQGHARGCSESRVCHMSEFCAGFSLHIVQPGDK